MTFKNKVISISNKALDFRRYSARICLRILRKSSYRRLTLFFSTFTRLATCLDLTTLATCLLLALCPLHIKSNHVGKVSYVGCFHYIHNSGHYLSIPVVPSCKFNATTSITSCPWLFVKSTHCKIQFINVTSRRNVGDYSRLIKKWPCESSNDRFGCRSELLCGYT